MNKNIKYTITESQMTIITISSMIGLGALSIANVTCEYAAQDGWISTFLGSIYPFYIVLLCYFVSNKYPKEDILTVSKKCFGKILGNVFNFIYMMFFFTYIVLILSGLSNILRVYIVSFLSPLKIILIATLVIMYAGSYEIGVIGNINQIIFYSTLILFFIPIVSLNQGSFLNVSPILGSGLNNIFKSSFGSIYAYGGIEIIFLIYPAITDSKRIFKSTLKGTIAITIIYTWFAFSTIFYLSPEIISKFLWSFMPVIETLKLPIINNFRYIFIFMWTLIILRTLTNYYYVVFYVMKNLMSDLSLKVSKKKICAFLYPLFVILSIQIKDEVERRALIDLIIPKFTLVMTILLTILTIIALIRKEN